ncbi:hypothetical protein NUW58_g8950 [Xylaria curta]|uniref:Uncharacterized protein n=1 Tax=Xylaria curta TaxID=42375 RepID=A0ACC1N2Z2_9PEZI|nr:hypothetical protein NUW58_g8950 [Xylaria curta]
MSLGVDHVVEPTRTSNSFDRAAPSALCTQQSSTSTNEPPPTGSQVTILRRPQPEHSDRERQPDLPTHTWQMASIPHAPSPPEAPTLASYRSDEDMYGPEGYADHYTDFPEYAASTPRPLPSVRFNPVPFMMAGMQTDPLIHRDFKDELTRAAGVVTPGVSDAPYLRYAIAAITGQQQQQKRNPTLRPGIMIYSYSASKSSTAAAHQPLLGVYSGDEPMSAGWQTPLPTPTIPGVEQQALIDQRQPATTPARTPEQTRIDEISADFNRAKELVEQGITALVNDHSPPRTVDVWRAQPDSFLKHDLEALGRGASVPPPLTHKPWILRPASLLLLATLCVLMIVALIFSAIYSIGRSGFTAYAGTIYGGQYFLFRVLPQLIGAILLIYAQCVIAAVFRVFPFSAMASDDRRERRNAVFLPLYPKSFLWPQLFGPWHVWVPTLVVWLTNFTIPLLSSLYTVVLVDGVWTWSTVQGVAWTLVAVYVSLLLATVVLFVYWRHRRTGMIDTWDVRSIADIIFLVSQSNSLPQYRGLETAATRRTMEKVLDGTAERLGYWTTPEFRNPSLIASSRTAPPRQHASQHASYHYHTHNSGWCSSSSLIPVPPICNLYLAPRRHPACYLIIVGAGPVGLMLSTCLSRLGYRIKHVDNRAEPTPTGRADGIQPRSLDLLRNLGLKSAIMRHKPARVYEVAFWDPAEATKGIVRTGTWASCPAFIDARYPFTTLLHQGLIERVFISDLEKHGVEIQRPWQITGFKSDEKENPEYPVEVSLEHMDGTNRETVRAKYLFGGEGARSFVREQLGIRITHKDPIAHVWGVMDGVVKTDFPDIKMKCTIHSEHGSIMVIPRENNMVRLYIQIASSTDPDWNPRKTATAAEVQASAKKILQPYSVEWESVEWYSVYPIGQGISDKYTLDHRVFLGGDACHTHSPKAGQGMNTAFLDAQNLAWKIHAVEAGLAERSLLTTYEPERREVAENLLSFDNKYAKLFSQRLPAATEVQAASRHTNGNSEDNEFIKTFKEACEFTSGYGVAYGPNALNWSPSHPAQSQLINPKGIRLRTGRIMANADVTRVVDANIVHLEQEIPWNGSFRIYIFAVQPTQPILHHLHGIRRRAQRD